MNMLNRVFEGVIAAISPVWALERLMVINGYEAAKRTRTHEAKRSSMGANDNVGIAGKSLREQARWLDENHDIAIGILDKLEERVVGARGIMVDPQPLNKDGSVNNELAAEIEKRWNAFSLRPEVTGRFTRPQMERLVLRSWLRDGEIFAQIVRGNVTGYQYLTQSKFALELLEADFVPINMTEAKEKVKQGIAVDMWNRPKGYHVLMDHPGEGFGVNAKTKFIRQANMLHLALIKRVHQLRGVTLFHGIITRLADLKQYEESERVAARIAAALGFYIKKGTPDMYQVPKSGQKNEPREFPFYPGMTFDNLEVGEEVGMVESNRPNTHLVPFRDGQLKASAGGTRSSYSSISRDYSGSYSSQRQELVEAHEGFAVLQDEFVAQWSRPVYRAWLAAELVNGLKVPSEVDKSTLFDAVYSAPVMPWIDPDKESKAWTNIIKGAAGSETEWIRARGKQPKEVKNQLAQDRKTNEELGIASETDPTLKTGAKANETTEKKPDGGEPDGSDADDGGSDQPTTE